MTRSSARFGSFIAYAGLVGDPVYFPGFAAIFGEGLFKVSGIWSDVGPNISNEDSSAIERLLIEELTTSVLELTDRG
jgi:hypothetical protein